MDEVRISLRTWFYSDSARGKQALDMAAQYAVHDPVAREDARQTGFVKAWEWNPVLTVTLNEGEVAAPLNKRVLEDCTPHFSRILRWNIRRVFLDACRANSRVYQQTESLSSSDLAVTPPDAALAFADELRRLRAAYVNGLEQLKLNHRKRFCELVRHPSTKPGDLWGVLNENDSTIWMRQRRAFVRFSAAVRRKLLPLTPDDFSDDEQIRELKAAVDEVSC